MKSTILIAAAIAAILPAAAQAQTRFSEKVNGWTVAGEGGDCNASTVSGGRDLVMIHSPASGGENQGGFTITRVGAEVAEGESATLTMSGNGGWSGEHPLRGYADPPSFWIAFADAGDADTLDDAWTASVSRGGKTVLTMSVTGFAAAREAMHRCVAQTR